MIVKNKILNKVLKIYLAIFSLFSLLCVNVVLNNITIYYKINNRYTTYIIFIITLISYLVMIFTVDDWNNDKEN